VQNPESVPKVPLVHFEVKGPPEQPLGQIAVVVWPLPTPGKRTLPQSVPILVSKQLSGVQEPLTGPNVDPLQVALIVPEQPLPQGLELVTPSVTLGNVTLPQVPKETVLAAQDKGPHKP
jgi:hypothetical protein